MNRTLCVCLIVILPLAPGAISAATYYVNGAAGFDDHPGTFDQPWLTIGKAAATLQPGDTVLVRFGTYPERVVPQNSGTAAAPITYSAYPGETPLIDGTGLELPEWSGLFDVSGRDHIRILGFRVENAGPTDHSTGIQADSSSHIVIQGNTVGHTTDSGIMVWGSRSVLVRENDVEDACINLYNECITVGASQAVEVCFNTVRGSAKEGICVKDGSSFALVYGNTVRETGAVGFYVDAQAEYTHDIQVFDNVSFDGVEDGFAVASEVGGLLENVRLYNNVAYANGWAGFDISDCCIESHPMQGIVFVNNTAFDNGVDWGGGFLHQNPQAEGVVIRNNLASQNLTFQIAVGATVPAGSYTVDHNLIDGFRGGEDEIHGDDFVEGAALLVDPASGDFRLQAGSPAIDRASADQAPGLDHDGDLRPQGAGHDIGADERSDQEGSTTVRLAMPAHRFSPGSPCWLRATLHHPGAQVSGVPLVCVLDVYGAYWFGPGWGDSLDWWTIDLASGETDVSLLPEFVWPDTGPDQVAGIRFWAAMTDSAMAQLLGGQHGIGVWDFGFGP